MASTELPVALTIAGSDSGAGAGIQADLLTFAAHEVFGTTAVTCLTAQNPDGVTAIEVLPAAFVAEQIQQVHRFFTVRALKTGMLYSADIIDVVADFLRAHRQIPAVIDPVMVATSGAVLLKPEALAAVRAKLLPLATLVTPNLDEVGVLLGMKPATAAEMTRAGRELARSYGVPFLHQRWASARRRSYGRPRRAGGGNPEYQSPRLDGIDTHGSGCTLSAAIAANLAQGRGLSDAVEAARDYLLRGFKQSLTVRGRRVINHRP